MIGHGRAYGKKREGDAVAAVSVNESATEDIPIGAVDRGQHLSRKSFQD